MKRRYASKHYWDGLRRDIKAIYTAHRWPLRSKPERQWLSSTGVLSIQSSSVCGRTLGKSSSRSWTGRRHQESHLPGQRYRIIERKIAPVGAGRRVISPPSRPPWLVPDCQITRPHRPRTGTVDNQMETRMGARIHPVSVKSVQRAVRCRIQRPARAARP